MVVISDSPPSGLAWFKDAVERLKRGPNPPSQFKVGPSWANEPQVTPADLDAVNAALAHEGIEPINIGATVPSHVNGPAPAHSQGTLRMSDSRQEQQSESEPMSPPETARPATSGKVEPRATIRSPITPVARAARVTSSCRSPV
jgi:hypothetical protein